MGKDARLLPSQRKQVFDLINHVGLNPDHFRWQDADELQGESRHRHTISVSRLVFRTEPSYRFQFGTTICSYCPGREQRSSYYSHKGDWKLIAVTFEDWLTALTREVKTVDPWDTLRDDALDRLQQAELADSVLTQAKRRTSAAELREAHTDLKRRPPDLTGAVQHSLAALECVAREHCGDFATLGKLLERYADLFPKPLDKGIEKFWGFASEMGRHLREGRTPNSEEVELLVGLATVCCTYLIRKIRCAPSS
jgi:hypothetical protein